jgi:TonB family protein
MHVFAGAADSLSLLIACTMKITLILSLAFLVVAVLRRNSSATRHHVWAAAIIATLLLPFCIAILPAWHSTALSSPTASLASARAAAPATTVPALPTIIVNAVAGSSEFNAFAGTVLAFWAFGLLLFATRLLVGFSRLAWLSTRSKPFFEDVWMHDALNLSNSFGISRSVRLLECRSTLAMPLTCGVFRPVVILPGSAAHWTEERRRIVLSHELAHIARHDWLLQICAELARALYWFHPLVWLAAARLRQESERACDDAVLLSGIAPIHYANQLLDLARTLRNSRRAWSTALAIARPTNLERRFAAMLNSSVNRNNPSQKTRLLIPVFTLALLVPLAALRLSGQNLSGKISGSVHDPSGTGVVNATIIMFNHAAKTIDMTTSDRDGNFVFKSLPAGDYEFEVVKTGFEEYKIPQIRLDDGRDLSEAVLLKIGHISEQVNVTPENSEKPLITQRTDSKPARLSVGGTIEAAKLLKPRVMPVYPDSAKSAGVQGTVVLHAVISKEGEVLSLRVVNSQIDPDLAKSAVQAVSQWRYTPTLLNGEPVEIDTTIQVNYTLNP